MSVRPRGTEGLDAGESDGRRLAHRVVESAISALGDTNLKPASDSMLRAFLAFKAIHRDGPRPAVSGQDIERSVKEIFTLLPTPDGVADDMLAGTIRLRGSGGYPSWMNNDSYRGSFQDYVGPSSPGRVMFEHEDWHRPMRADAVAHVIRTMGRGRYRWPPRDALATIALRNDLLRPGLHWEELEALARERFGVSEQEWESVTSPRALHMDPFDGEPWDPARLAAGLRPPGAEREHVQRVERQVEELPACLSRQVERVMRALSVHGHRSIVALAGVPGTSKSYVARIAARAFASDNCLREIQFSPAYTYEELIEGPRYDDGMKVVVVPGAMLELNERALEHPDKQYVLLVEELSRADLPRVLGELLTYLEYRGETDKFTTLYERDRSVRFAPNIAILATYNPADRSAVNVDAAMLRRMRILDFPPDVDLLREILLGNGLDEQVIAQLVAMFNACEEVAKDRYEESMPFGHAVFSSVENERDLHALWHETLKHLLTRPHAPRHQLYQVIVEHYPWHVGEHVTVVARDAGGQLSTDEGDVE